MDNETLPGYAHLPPAYKSSEPRPPEQTYSLQDSKSRPWLWLKVSSRARPSEKRGQPFFLQGDIIRGAVEIDFGKTDSAKSLLIAVTGGVTTVGQEEELFLNVTEELWNSNASPKPQGKQTFKFSLQLPAEVSVVSEKNKPPQQYPLPPYFSERASTAYIDYKLVVTVRRGGWRVNQTLEQIFAYLPMSYAEPSSALRQLAYQDGSPLLGPDGDPAGWKVSPPIKVAGTLFNTRPIEVTCTFAIANPLTYAIGSPIPFFITITSPDQQALDLLSAPSAIRVQLLRERLIGGAALKEDAPAESRSNNTFRVPMGSASFWPVEEGKAVDGKKALQGELAVAKGLKPGFSFPRFSTRYSVSLLQFQAPGFTPSFPDAILLNERVTLTIGNAPGIAPRSYAPPNYEQITDTNYNNSLGYLENGNQRFLHHAAFA